jgi:hypothetical protein
VLRAGFTDVSVTEMLKRWIKVRPRPTAMGAKPIGTRFLAAPGIIGKE